MFSLVVSPPGLPQRYGLGSKLLQREPWGLFDEPLLEDAEDTEGEEQGGGGRIVRDDSSDGIGTLTVLSPNFTLLEV